MVNPQPKVKIWRSPKYLRFIRSLPCCVCGGLETEAAHQRIFGSAGTGIKPPDSMAIPLCHNCHTMEHSMGAKSFWDSYAISTNRFWEIIKCLTLYLEKTKSQ